VTFAGANFGFHSFALFVILIASGILFAIVYEITRAIGSLISFLFVYAIVYAIGGSDSF
jgi:hypothetical protein